MAKTKTVQLSDKQRAQIVNSLTTNCDCQTAAFNEDDQAFLLNREMVPDGRLVDWYEKQQLAVNQQRIATAAAKGIGGQQLVFNEETDELELNACDEEMQEDGEEDVDVQRKEKKKGFPPVPPTGGFAGNSKQTKAQWLSQQPPEIQAVFNHAQGILNQEKAGLMKVILTNVANKAAGYTKEVLVKMEIPELKRLASFAQNSQAPATDEDEQVFNMLGVNSNPHNGYGTADFGGSAGGPLITRNTKGKPEDTSPLVPKKLDFVKNASPLLVQRLEEENGGAALNGHNGLRPLKQQ